VVAWRKESNMNDSQNVCDCCRLVPLSYLSLDLPEPLAGWEEALTERGVGLVFDDIGRPSVERGVLGELIAEHREREVRALEDQRRRFERADLKLPTGVPAIDGSPYEALVAAGEVILPSEEFAGRPRPNFIAEELEAGQRESAERRRAAARMKDALSGGTHEPISAGGGIGSGRLRPPARD
jgi:hypothetical protein